MDLKLLDPRTDFAAVEDAWTSLLAACPHSYFLSWRFVEQWLRHLPVDAPVRLATFTEDGRVLAAGFLGYARSIRQRVFRSTAYFLNGTGKRTQDQLYIEDNALLCRAGEALPLNHMLDLLPGPWDELYLPGVDPCSGIGAALGRIEAPYSVMIHNRAPAPFVDLEAARRRGYLALLGSGMRSQIRRCYKLFSPVETTVAQDLGTALDIFGELVALHQSWWARKGGSGAFSNPWFLSFHRDLIASGFSDGNLQLIRVTSGGSTVGCLYNFAYGGTVSFYSGGFQWEGDNRRKPGFLCHAEAIRCNAELGYRTYEFLAGFEPYKSRMATHQRELLWVRVQKPRLRFAVERAARGAAFYVLEKTGRRPGGTAPAAEAAR